MITLPTDPLSALERATARAIAYRRSISMEERTPTASYGAIHTPFDGPLPEHGEAADAVIETEATLAEPGIRASTAPRCFGGGGGG